MEAIAVTYMRGESGLAGGNREQSGPGKTRGFVDGLDVRYERQREVRIESKVFGLSSQRMVLPFVVGKDGGQSIFRRGN